MVKLTAQRRRYSVNNWPFADKAKKKNVLDKEGKELEKQQLINAYL